MAGFMSRSTVSPAESPLLAGLYSARALLGPGLVLQGAALALVLTYYFVPAAAGFFATLGRWQTEGGFAFSAVSTAVCGGVIPFLFLRAHRDTRATHPWSHLGFFIAYWAWKGAEVDLWYRSLAWVFGHDHAVRTIVSKILADQFAYNPFYAAPCGNLFFAWKDAGFRWGPVLADIRAGGWYRRRVLPVLISVWCLWIPVVACVYSLPSPLQMPLFNIVLCFWSMLFAHITSRQAAKVEC